jgi:hypothetical protein
VHGLSTARILLTPLAYVIRHMSLTSQLLARKKLLLPHDSQALIRFTWVHTLSPGYYPRLMLPPTMHIEP